MPLARILRHPCALSAAGALTLFSACSGNKTAANQTGATTAAKGPVIAHVGDGAITADEFKLRAQEQPVFQRQRLQTLAGRKELLENMEKFEILAQAAEKQGLDKTPEMQATIKRVLVQELVKQFYEQKIEPTDEDLKAYYDKHQQEFVKTEQRRVQQIFLAAPEGTTEEAKKAREQAKKKAESLVAQLQSADTKVAVAKEPSTLVEPLPLFSELASKNSTDATKNAGGDTLARSRDELARQFSVQFATAVFALSPEKRLSAVIETPKGFHVARLLQVQPASTRTLDEVKPQIKDRVVQEQRTKRFDEFYEKLKKETPVTVDEKELQAVEVPQPKPASMGGPFGGMVGHMPSVNGAAKPIPPSMPHPVVPAPKTVATHQ